MRFAHHLSIAFSFVVATICTTVLIGWSSDNELLKTGWAVVGSTAMNPTTALAFLLSCVALWCGLKSEGARATCGRIAASLVVGIGGIKLFDYAFDVRSGIDRLLFVDQLGVNRMAPNTAAAFTLLGLSLLLIDRPLTRRIRPGDLFAVSSAMLSLLCLVGYLFDAQAMYGVGAHIPMALNTALAFELLSIGVLLARPERGVVGALRSGGLGGVAARRLLPIAVTVPIALGWICEYGQQAELYDSAFAAALMVTISVVLFGGAIGWTAIVLNEVDRNRLRAEHELRVANEELDRRVADRTAELTIANDELSQRNQDIRRAAEDLKKRDDQLRQSQKMEAVGTLAGGVAHEFNNLLQAIQAYTQFAMDGLAAEEPRYQDLRQVLTAAERASALTRQLLGFGRRQSLELKHIDPNQLVKDLVKLVKPLIGSTIVVDVKLDEKVGMIHADAGQFQQLMMNLCINARDAMPDGGSLLIKSDDVILNRHYCDVHPGIEPGRYLALTVSDTGTGMSSEVVEHIFEPFYTTKGVGKGTGLGLSMVYGLVQQHHGVIHVYSEVGHGTTFKIHLPTVDCEVGAEVVEARAPQRGGSETILVADDESLVHDIYLRVLGRGGYRLLSARDGREAWELFQAHRDEIDLLVLDVMMPQLSGREVYRRAQEIRSDMPAIFCSGYDPETAHIRFAEDDGLPFLQKPFDPDDLLRTVREVLDREALCLK